MFKLTEKKLDRQITTSGLDLNPVEKLTLAPVSSQITAFLADFCNK